MDWLQCIKNRNHRLIYIYEQKTEVNVVEVTNKTQPTEFEE